jgi:hypothetical protein
MRAHLCIFGKIYVLGGDFGSLKYNSNKLFIYDPASNIWKEGKLMPTARYGLADIFDNMRKRIYAIGCGIEVACCSSNINVIFPVAKG